MFLHSCRVVRHALHPLLFLGIFYLAILPTSLGHAVPNVIRSAQPRDDVGNLNIVPRQDFHTINIATVSSIALSVANRMAQYSTVQPIPLPTNIPHYKELRQLADMMPIVQNDPRGSASTQGQPEGGDPAPESPKLMPRSIDARSGNNTQLSTRAGPMRVMVVGDSMTQGAQADWTWRYRMWEWFRSQNVAVDFVGPYVGTQNGPQAGPPQPPPIYGENPPASSGQVADKGGYAPDVASDFDSNHFSVWGRAAATDRSLIADQLRQYPTDLMLLMLGFNDLGWFYSDSCGTLDSIRAMVQAAREVNPNIKFAIANVVQRTDLGRKDLPAKTDAYNALLRDSIPRWTTPESPIGLVELRENYSCELSGCPAGYDGLHPGTLGDFQIAQAFSKTLVNVLKIGTSPLQVPNPLPQRAKPVPTNFQVMGSPGGILATWDAVYTARGYDVRTRIAGVTDWSVGAVGTNRLDLTWTLDGSTYDVQVRVSLGENDKGDWTEIRSAVSHPRTAPPPANATVRATASGVDVSFQTPTGPYSDSIFLYNLIFWDLDTECAYIAGAGFRTTNIHLDGLNPGHRYLIAIATWNAAGGGFPGIYNGVVVGAGTPPVPSNFRATAKDGASIILNWDGSSSAYGYQVWIRNINDGSPLARGASAGQPCAEGYFLFPGVWNYEFCVSALNGNDESARSNCIIPQAPKDNSNAGLSCPPIPKWCDNPPSGPPGTVGPSQCPATSSLGNGPGAGTSSTVSSRPTTTVITTTTTGADGKPTTVTRTVTNPPVTTTAGAQTTVITTTTTGSDGKPTTITRTITNPPATTTSSASNNVQTTVFTTTVTGQDGKTTIVTRTTTVTIRTTTSGAGVTTSNAPLTTYSTFPSTIQWSSTYVQSNTHDSSGHPILAPWPTCWFCPGGSNGIALTGFSIGVYPSGGPPAGLPTPFPMLTIGVDGNPTYPPSPSGSNTATKTSTACTSTSTVSECSADCIATTLLPTTGYSCTTTCSNTQIGCGVSGTTRSTTKTASYPNIGDGEDDDFVIVSNTAYAADFTSQSSAASVSDHAPPPTTSPSASPPVTTTSAAPPTSTSFPPAPAGQLAIAVYNDDSCNDLVAYYREGDLYNKCNKLTRVAKSYKFYQMAVNCDINPPRNGFKTVQMFKTETCPPDSKQGVGEIVGGGCGRDPDCHKTTGDATAIKVIQAITGA